VVKTNGVTTGKESARKSAKKKPNKTKRPSQQATERLIKRLGFDRIVLIHEDAEGSQDLCAETATDNGYGSEFIRHWDTRVEGLKWAPDDEEQEDEPTKTVIGSFFSHTFLHDYALDSGRNLVYEADYDGEMEEAVSIARRLTSDDDPIVQSFRCKSLYIHRMYLEPKFRGTGLGQMLVRRVIEYHDPGSLALVLVMPSAGDYNLRADDPLHDVTDKDAETGRLARRFEEMGFDPYERDDPRDSDADQWWYLDMEGFACE